MTTVVAGVYRQAGQPDEVIPIKVLSDGTLSGAGGGGGGGGTSDTTEATQLQVLAKVTSIDNKTPAAGTAQPISAVSLPLPTGAATASKQDVAAASLASIDSKLPSQVLSSVPVVASARTCTGRQVLSISNSVSLSPAGGGITAMIQADGGSIRVSLDGTAASATSGIRLDDGVMLFIDSNLTNVRLFASVATTVQVAYFDRP